MTGPSQALQREAHAEKISCLERGGSTTTALAGFGHRTKPVYRGTSDGQADAMITPDENGTAVVTGASSGIGEQLARELSRRGYHVTLVARSVDKLNQLKDELGNADVVAADLADPTARADLLKRITRTPNILVNNAGLSTLGPV